MLAPTDAALGLGVFTDRSVPARIRRALNVESGLNDGLATPLVTIFLAVVVAQEGVGPESWLGEAAQALGLAILVATLVGVGVGRLLAAASGGRLREATEFTEDLGLIASYLVWAIFGALLVAPLLTHEFRPSAIVYALVSLTLVRIVPVAIALAGTGLRPVSIAFMGWFGPRGLASVVFTLLAFESLEAGGLAPERLIEVATWTILLSIIAHGVTARPLAAAYGRTTADAPVEHHEPAPQLETRVPRGLSARRPERGVGREPDETERQPG